MLPPSINTTMISEDKYFDPAISNTKKIDVCGTIIPFVATRTGYHDLTDALPQKSSRGNQYIYFLYDYDGNAVLTQPINNRQAAIIRDSWVVPSSSPPTKWQCSQLIYHGQ